jgi:hypothetical protein
MLYYATHEHDDRSTTITLDFYANSDQMLLLNDSFIIADMIVTVSCNAAKTDLQTDYFVESNSTRDVISKYQPKFSNQFIINQSRISCERFLMYQCINVQCTNACQNK